MAPLPPPARQDIIAKTHADTGHFGQRRTQHLLLLSFWWPGLYSDVIKHCQNCAVCSRVDTIFNAGDKQLHPIPANGLFYRWSCDLAGPFVATPRGNTYNMLCIEHFKHLIVTAIPSKTAAQTAAVFRDQVLSTFGACAKVATDSGTVFKGAFDNLLVEYLIDYRIGSPNHPQSQGQVERVVQTIKQALRRMVQASGQMDNWDEKLAALRIGYNASKHASTGISPAQVLFACDPVIPPAIVERFATPL